MLNKAKKILKKNSYLRGIDQADAGFDPTVDGVIAVIDKKNCWLAVVYLDDGDFEVTEDEADILANRKMLHL